MSLVARGSFRVELTPQPPASGSDGIRLGRMALSKVFEGDLQAASEGQMLSAMTPVQGSAGYVAIEQVSGVLQGRSGSFVLQHSGIMERGAPQASIVVVPDSGTGELAGISGSMQIEIVDGGHRYTFTYRLP